MPKALAPETIDTHLRIPREDYEALEREAVKQERTVSNLIRLLIHQGLDRLEQRGS